MKRKTQLPQEILDTMQDTTLQLIQKTNEISQILNQDQTDPKQTIQKKTRLAQKQLTDLTMQLQREKNIKTKIENRKVKTSN